MPAASPLLRPALVLVLLTSLAVIPPAIGVHPDTGPDRACGSGVVPTQTSGEGPDGLVYAALKTGTRAVVAWSTATDIVGSLTFNVSRGTDRVLTESTARRHHVFVLDALPRGETLCFTTSSGARAALPLRNAMYAHDGSAYVINLLVLANEQPNKVAVEVGMRNYAARLLDATDGHVKSGRIVVLYNDLEHHNSGWHTCYLVGVASLSPTCRHAADVLFTADASTGGAASTYKDGIRNTRQAIWMNSYHQAGAVNTGDDVGAVLMHEMGHYAFGAMDLYLGSACNVHGKSLSVMSGDRSLTEFDDDVNRCPNANEIPSYVPSYTLLRQRFPLVPDRQGLIDEGPVGTGNAFALHAFDLAPLVVETPQGAGLDDDAGSGRDAGAAPGSAVAVQPGVKHAGRAGGPDVSDHYAFQAAAGQQATLAVTGAPGCHGVIVDASGGSLSRGCTVHPDGASRVTAQVPSTGTWYLRITSPGPYRFVVTVDGSWPAPAP